MIKNIILFLNNFFLSFLKLVFNLIENGGVLVGGIIILLVPAVIGGLAHCHFFQIIFKIIA
jgi:hypothetical protein